MRLIDIDEVIELLHKKESIVIIEEQIEMSIRKVFDTHKNKGRYISKEYECELKDLCWATIEGLLRFIDTYPTAEAPIGGE